MIDRIEELLGLLAAEDEEEQGQEEVLALSVAEDAVPASPREDGEEAGEVWTDRNRSGGWTVEATARSRPALAIGETEDGGWTVGEIVPERPGLIGGEAGGGSTEDRRGGPIAGETLAVSVKTAGEELAVSVKTAGETLAESVKTAGEAVAEGAETAGEAVAEGAETAGELWKDGPVWTVQSVKPETAGVRRTEAAERTVQTGEALQPPQGGDLILAGLARATRGAAAGLALEGAGRSEPARSGLEGLYRQTVQGLRPAAPALTPGQTEKTVRVQEPGSAAALTVDELDRAVRRDSRRYDGGMSIY